MSNVPGATSWLDRYFVSCFVPDEAGRAVLTATETITSGDPVVTIAGKYSNAATSANADLDITLPWSVAAGDVWALEVYITAKGTGIRRKIKLSGVLYHNGTGAAIDGTPDNDTKGTGTPAASLQVLGGSGTSMVLRLTPGTASAVTWGYEVRAQKI